MDKRYQKTVYACFVGYIVQAIVNNFVPLLFLTFHSTYGIPLTRITFLVTVNFCIQLGVDLLSVKFVDRIGYRAAMILAHGTAAFGLMMLAVLPEMMPDPYTGILIAVVFYAIGGGLLRDLFVQRMPGVLHKHVYAAAVLAGAVVYLLLYRLHVSDLIATPVTIGLVFSIRMLATKYRWNLPHAE